MKTCTKCKTSRHLSDFRKDRKRKDGLQCWCDFCLSAYRIQTQGRHRLYCAEYYAAHGEEMRESNKRRRRSDPARARALDAPRNEKRKEQRAQARKVRAEMMKARSKAQRVAKCRLRAARKKRAIPAWADQAEILRHYEAAQRLTAETGIPHHVDHVVPLSSPLVCGLHWHRNLAVVPKWANLMKGNRHWPDMPQ